MEKKTQRILLSFVIALVIIIVSLGIAIKYSAPAAPPTMEVIASPFRTMDFSKLPPASIYTARDQAELSYRAYLSPAARQAIVLIHGSSGSSIMMHALAEYLRGQGIDVYVPDVRGHGESGTKGDIAYIGQLEDDLEDFIHDVLKDKADLTLVGFSSGGGFALRFAGSERQNYFDRYVLLAPFIRYDAPTTRKGNDKWASASVFRILGISLLGSMGEKWLGNLPVIAFGIDPKNAQHQTGFYSYRLWKNFGAHHDYKADMKNAQKPISVLVGKDDELMYPQEYLPLFAKWQPHVEINIVPDVGHISLITDEAGLAAIAEQISH